MQSMARRSLLSIGLVLALVTRAAGSEADDQYAVAAAHYSRKRWELAVEEFRAFLARHADHPKANDARFFLGEALVQLGRLDEAREAFQVFLSRAAEHRYRRQALFRVGETAYLSHAYDVAQRELTRFRKTYPDDPLNEYVLPYLGEIALQRGKADRAATLFREALQRFPEGRLKDDCRLGLAKALQQAHKYDAAVETLAELTTADGPLADDAQFQLAAAAYAQGNWDQAIRVFEQFEERFPDSPLRDKARLGKAWALFRLERYAEARDVLATLVDSPRVGLEARYWLGLAYKALKQWTTAAEQLERVANNAEGRQAAEARFHAGQSRLREGKTQAALAHFDKILSARPRLPSDLEAQAMLGKLRALIALGDASGIDDTLNKISQRFPNSETLVEAERLKDRWLLETAQHDRVIRRLEQIVAGQADRKASADDRLLLAKAYYQAGRYDDTLATVDPLVKQTTGELLTEVLWQRATALIALRRYEEAIEPLRRVLAARSEGAQATEYRRELLVCLVHSGRADEAKRLFEELSQAKPDGAKPLAPDDILRLADAAYEVGEYRWAERLYRQLLAKAAPKAAASNDLKAKSLSGLAWSLRQQEKWDEAAKTFAEFLDRFPHHRLAGPSALARAQILEKLDQADAALSLYRRLAEQQSPDDSTLSADALLAGAALLDRLEQNRESAEWLDRFLKRFPAHPKTDAALYRRAWVARELKDESTAKRYFEKLRTQFPDSAYWADAVYRLAEAAFRDGQYENARQLADKLIESQRDEALARHALYLKGQTLAIEGRWEVAQRAFERLLDDGRDDELALLAAYWWAEAAYRLRHYDEAGERLDALSDKVADLQEPWVAMVELRRAQIRAQKKKWNEALEIATAIGKRFPDFNQQYEADYVVGRCLAMQARFDEAREAYRRVTRSPEGAATETAAMAQWMIGETFFHQKDYRTAIREYLRLEVLYDYPRWQSAALLQAGKCYEQLQQWDQARELYARLLKEFPNTPFADEAAQRLQTANRRTTARG